MILTNVINTDYLAGGAFEPQRSNSGVIYIEDLSGNDLIPLCVASFPIPNNSSNIIEVQHGAFKRKFAGSYTQDDMTVNFIDYVNQDIAGVLARWRQTVANVQTQKVGAASQYKKNGYVLLKGPSTSISATPDETYDRRWILNGVWPSAFQPGDIDLEGDDKVRISMTLTIDFAYPAWIGSGASLLDIARQIAGGIQQGMNGLGQIAHACGW